MKLFKNWLLISLLSCVGMWLSVCTAKLEFPEAVPAQKQEAFTGEEEVKEREAVPEQELELPSRHKRTPLLKKLLTRKEQEAKRVQLLTIFLDEQEVYPRTVEFPVTEGLFAAIRDKAGPIIVSTLLLYNILKGPFVNKKERLAAEFKKMFSDGEDWFLSEIVPGLLLLVPKSYLAIQNMSLHELGLKIGSLCTAEDISALAKQAHAVNKGKGLAGDRFVDALCDNKIFDLEQQESAWIIYIDGHGEYGKYIAAITLNRFSHMLDFFDKKIRVALCVYNACYAAGLNAELVYKELMQGGVRRPKEYSFAIVTQATGDITTSALFGEELDFEGFMREFRAQFGLGIINYENALRQFKEVHNLRIESELSPQELKEFMKEYRSVYSRLLMYIMPYLKILEQENESIDPRQKGNIPHIRFPHTAAWFPVIGDRGVIVRISEVMAMTRTAALSIGAEKKIEQPIKAVLFDTDYIPFDIVIEELAYPHFVITLPGDVEIYIQKIVDKHVRSFRDFVFVMGIEHVEGHYERGNKVMYIKELELRERQGRGVIVPAVYTDVVIDFANKTAFYTDKHNKQYKMHITQGVRFERAGEITFGECESDYRLAYPDPLLAIKSIIDKGAKRHKIQQMEQMLTKQQGKQEKEKS